MSGVGESESMRWQQIHIPGLPGYPLRRLKTDRFWFNRPPLSTSTVIPSDVVLLCPPIPAELLRSQSAEPTRAQDEMMFDYAKKCMKVTGLKP